MPLAKANPQTAFGLLADPAALTEDCVAALAACRNLVVMPLLNTPELTPEACRAARRMKAQKMFYALTVLVDDDTVDEVMQDDWLESIAQETLFCVCARKTASRTKPPTDCAAALWRAAWRPASRFCCSTGTAM